MENTKEITTKNINTITTSNMLTETKKHKFLTIFAVGTMTSALILLLTLLFWLIYPYKVIESSPHPFPISNNQTEVYQGDSISYEYNYIKYIDTPVQVKKQFVDGIIFEAQSLVTTKPVGTGCVVSEVPIPRTLPPGVYHIRIIAEYKVNPIRTIEIVNETEEFTVLEAVEK